MKTPEEIIREVRLTTASKIHDCANALEQAMREPVGHRGEYGGVLNERGVALPLDTKLYAFPPDAEEEIRYLRSRLADATKANDLFQTAADAEIKRLQSVYNAARGLCHGYDWNKGTHARAYRNQLILAVNAIDPIPDVSGKIRLTPAEVNDK
jgi:hypothetical protein